MCRVYSIITTYSAGPRFDLRCWWHLVLGDCKQMLYLMPHGEKTGNEWNFLYKFLFMLSVLMFFLRVNHVPVISMYNVDLFENKQKAHIVCPLVS